MLTEGVGVGVGVGIRYGVSMQPREREKLALPNTYLLYFFHLLPPLPNYLFFLVVVQKTIL